MVIIYKVTNIVNNKMYIGQTVRDLKNRKNNHLSAAKLHKYNSHFHNALRKYGSDNFDWEIIHDNIDDIDFLNRLELFYIDYYDTFDSGYNLTLGGGGMSGFKRSDESRKKQSLAKIGKKHSEKAKKNMSENHVDFSGNKHPNYGKYGKDSTFTKATIINNERFDTRKEAAKVLGITPPALRYRILHKTKWLDYSYV